MTNELIQQVKKINRQAALFLVKKVPLLVQRGKLHSTLQAARSFVKYPSNDLPCAFVFEKTPQGHEYWYDISKKLPSPYGW